MSQASSAQPNETSTSEGTPSQEFRPVEGGGDTKSGEMLLVQAYAIIWLLAFGLIVFSIRKQRKLDDRIARLQEDLAKARTD
jgi:CcmD family protein